MYAALGSYSVNLCIKCPTPGWLDNCLRKRSGNALPSRFLDVNVMIDRLDHIAEFPSALGGT